ncbi:MAG: competence/damage-inducible protein A [Deltaproteobacteria bacterium]|nr:competence/damage-inducible protein A [Deltaproteobacteria bacterium]
MSAEVITIGDELLRGEIVDSNKALLSELLLRADLPVRFHVSVLDDPQDMADAFRRAAQRSAVVLVSGGLGPTRDDITLPALARCFGLSLQLHEPSLRAIRAFFRERGRPMAPSNEKQALLPEGATALPNPLGTAPGCMLRAGGAVFFCLPGVPRELAHMAEQQVLPRLPAPGGARGVLRSELLRTFGIGESSLEDELADLARGEGLSLGFRTSFPDNFLRPCARGASEAEAGERLAGLCRDIEARLGPLLYGRGDETMQVVVGRLLAAGGFTLALAESCTGGLLAERVSGVPGASAWFRGGAVAYANDAKRALLGVPDAVLRDCGAVSEPVALALAQGARARFGADYGLATTGIGGPGGGAEDKPVGTVWVGFAGPQGARAVRFHFAFDRQRHRVLTTQVALDWLRRELQGVPAPAPQLLKTFPPERVTPGTG